MSTIHSLPRRDATLARFEQAIEILRDRYICAGWELDEEGAERALKYFRRIAQPGRRDENRDFRFVIAFLHDHELSYDWIFRGDVTGLIVASAATSARAARPGAAEREKARLAKLTTAA
jgi:hypothetical protein